EFPDGGFRAWAVVVGPLCLLLAPHHHSFGYTTSWGIFQVYYQQTILRHSSPSQIAWIGSVQVMCLPTSSPIAHGPQYSAACLLIIAGTFLIPLCKVYWYFLLCQGFMIGPSTSWASNPLAAIRSGWPAHWPTITAACAECSDMGCISVFQTYFNPLTANSFTWTLRIMGFILIFTFGLANLCLVRRLPPQNAEGGLFGLHVFRNAAFTVFSVSWFLIALGSFTVGAYLTTSAVSHDLSLNFAFYLVAIHNGASFFGAVLFGLYGDLIGAMNALIQGIAAIGVINVVWPFCGTVASLSVIAIPHGISLGEFRALALVPVAAMGGTEDLGRRIGIINTMLGLGTLCGPPLAGLFLSTSLGYKAVRYYSDRSVTGYLTAVC
ncbi:MFS general substrate transporter, partial [Mycena leptocephala]